MLFFRRYTATVGETAFKLACGLLSFDLVRRAASLGDDRIRLRQKEFELLLHLALRSPAIVSRAELLREICRIDFDPGTNIIEVHMSRLRATLAEHDAARMIETVRGAGYRLVPMSMMRMKSGARDGLQRTDLWS